MTENDRCSQCGRTWGSLGPEFTKADLVQALGRYTQHWEDEMWELVAGSVPLDVFLKVLEVTEEQIDFAKPDGF